MTDAPAPAAPAVDWDALLSTAAPETTRATAPTYDGPIPEKLRALIEKASQDGKRYVMKCAGQEVYDQFVAMGLAVAATLPAPKNNFYPRARFTNDAVSECSFVVTEKRTRPTKPKTEKAETDGAEKTEETGPAKTSAPAAAPPVAIDAKPAASNTGGTTRKPAGK